MRRMMGGVVPEKPGGPQVPQSCSTGTILELTALVRMELPIDRNCIDLPFSYKALILQGC